MTRPSRIAGAVALVLALAAPACRGDRVQCEPCDADLDCREKLACTKGESTDSVCLERCEPAANDCPSGLECNPQGRCIPVDAPDPPEASDPYGCGAWLAGE